MKKKKHLVLHRNAHDPAGFPVQNIVNKLVWKCAKNEAQPLDVHSEYYMVIGIAHQNVV